MASAEPPAAKPAFYSDALTPEERERLPAARELEGLEEEIATLRVRLHSVIQNHPDDLRTLAAGVQMLVRAVAAQYRLSPRARKDLAENITAVLNSLGDQLVPADR